MSGYGTARAGLPIGRILPDASVTIADEDGRAVAQGEIGEFVVASRYIALGYWGDPDLTARTFKVDPADSSIRIFRTGDMGRMRPDGLLEFVGRNDQQIKLRGHRIELGEIEFVLAGCDGVADAAVVVRRDEAGLPRSLIAYVELNPGIELQPRDLKSMLWNCLPQYMIPATINIIDPLPRLPNLKIRPYAADADRRCPRDAIGGSNRRPTDRRAGRNIRGRARRRQGHARRQYIVSGR